MNRPPVAVDLFSGAGGLAEGLQSAGVQIVASVELHPQPGLTHAFNHPATDVYVGDIRQLPLSLIEASVERRAESTDVDLVIGGPPCQGFSSAGKKVARDPRNDLFTEFARVVEHFRPAMFVLENVPDFEKRYRGQAWARASKLFSELGYEYCNTVLSCAGFGVPQRRRRFLAIGWLPGRVNEFHWPDQSHFGTNGEQLLPIFDETTEPFVTVSDALEDIAFLEPGWESHFHQNSPTADFQRQRRNGCDLLFNHLATQHREKAVKMFSFIPEGGTISSVPEEYRSAKRTMARWHRDKISNAVLALPDDLIHYRHNRIPTVRELARLQTFDDDFVFIGKRTSGFVERRVDVPQYTQIGNAVPPVLGRVLGFALLKCFGARRRDLRKVKERRKRHRWVRGSSGFAGYTLDPQAQGQITLFDMHGELLLLPTSEEDTPVIEAAPLREWVKDRFPRRGQWAPGVKPRSAPAWAR